MTNRQRWISATAVLVMLAAFCGRAHAQGLEQEKFPVGTKNVPAIVIPPISTDALTLHVESMASQSAPKRPWLFRPRGIRIGLICSSGAETYDAISTAYVIGRENGRIEAGLQPELGESNDIIEPATRSAAGLTSLKVGTAVGYNYAALWVSRDHPKVAAVMLYANCGAKLAIGANNERLLSNARRGR